MLGTIDGFRYGAVTPVAAYLMACLGGALGLRCVVRSLYNRQSWKAGWLALGATSIGSGIWTMHFIAMIGFQVEETRIGYDVGLTELSLVVAIVVVGIGVFAVGYRGATVGTLSLAGIVTGLGVAAMHYLGMAALKLNGDIEYRTSTVALSVLIAIVAATAALWAAVSIRGFLPSLGASLVMGVAVSGMHYTGMAAVSVHLHAPAWFVVGRLGQLDPASDAVGTGRLPAACRGRRDVRPAAGDGRGRMGPLLRPPPRHPGRRRRTARRTPGLPLRHPGPLGPSPEPAHRAGRPSRPEAEHPHEPRRLDAVRHPATPGRMVTNTARHEPT